MGIKIILINCQQVTWKRNCDDNERKKNERKKEAQMLLDQRMWTTNMAREQALAHHFGVVHHRAYLTSVFYFSDYTGCCSEYAKGGVDVLAERNKYRCILVHTNMDYTQKLKRLQLFKV